MPPDVRDDDFDNDELPENEERTTVGPLPTAEDVAPRSNRRQATPFATDDADSVTTNDEPRSPSKRAPAPARGKTPSIAARDPQPTSRPAATTSRPAANTTRPAAKPATQTARPAAKPAQQPAQRPVVKGWADQAVRSSSVRDRKEQPRDEVRRERPTRPAEEDARPTVQVDQDDVDAYASAAVDSEKTPPPEPKREARAKSGAGDRSSASQVNDDRPVRRAEPTVTKRPPRQEPDHTDAESDPWRGDDQEVLGAPERTVVAPLPPQEESVEPVPEAKPVRKKRPPIADDRARSRLSAQIDLDEHEPASRTSRRKTTVEGSGDPPPDNAWSRFKVAVVDLWRVVVLSVKTNWKILRTQGPKPFIERARPHVLRWWAKVKEWALIAWSYLKRWFFKARQAVTVQAEKLGLIKAQPRYEYEAESKDTADRARAEEWKKFQKGKTSSSYLQDDE